MELEDGPLSILERKRATAEMRGKPRTVQGQLAIETGAGKSVGFRGASERARAIWAQATHFHAGQRQPSMRRIKHAGHMTALDSTLGAGQGKTRFKGASTHESPISPAATADLGRGH